jgi:hypothetical protein
VKRKTPKKRKKPSLTESARKVTAILEEHLLTLPVEEREMYVASFERGVLRASRAKRRPSEGRLG